MSSGHLGRVADTSTEDCKRRVDTIFKKEAEGMRQVETSEWLKMLARIIRAAGRRVDEADQYELAQLVQFREQLKETIKIAIQGQRSSDRLWVGQALGLSWQGAFNDMVIQMKQSMFKTPRRCFLGDWPMGAAYMRNVNERSRCKKAAVREQDQPNANRQFR